MDETLKLSNQPAGEAQPGLSPEQAKMAEVTMALVDLMQRQKQYYSQIIGTSAELDKSLATNDKGTTILAELNLGWGQLQAGEVHKSKIPVIRLFEGEQTRRVDAPESDNNRLIEDLYNTFNQLAGGRGGGYHDLRARAERLKEEGKQIAQDSPFSHLMEDIALTDEHGRLTGLQFRVNPNLLIKFKVSNLSYNELKAGEGRVSLILYPKDGRSIQP